MKRIQATAIAVFVFAALSFAAPAPKKAAKTAKDRVYMGEIWDSTCAKAGTHTDMEKMAGIPVGNSRACVLKCVEMGSTYVLYNPKTKRIYKLDNQEVPKQFAGEKVKVFGTLVNGEIHVAKIEPAK
jgi:hypothetical protein